MLPGRRFALAAFSLIAGGCLHLSAAMAASEACGGSTEVTILPSPLAPWSGAPLRVMAVTEKPIAGELALVAPDGSVAVKSADRHEGPPYSWFAEVATPVAGTWHARLTGGGASDCSPVTRDIAV